MSAAGISAEPPAETPWTVHRLASPRQSAETEVHVLVPDRFDPAGKYRVLFVLPVEGGATTRWGSALTECLQHDLHNKFGLICVYPTFAQLPWYADHPADEKLQQERYLLEDVLPLIEQNYPVRKERAGRLLVGFSKSGWGAFSLLLRHPDVFEKAAAWDAPLTKTKPDQFGMGPIFGTQENFEKYQLTKLLEQNGGKLGEEPRLIHLGYDVFREHHAAFEQLLVKHNVPHVYHDGPKRKHAWDSGWLPEAVAALAK